MNSDLRKIFICMSYAPPSMYIRFYERFLFLIYLLSYLSIILRNRNCSISRFCRDCGCGSVARACKKVLYFRWAEKLKSDQIMFRKNRCEIYRFKIFFKWSSAAQSGDLFCRKFSIIFWVVPDQCIFYAPDIDWNFARAITSHNVTSRHGHEQFVTLMADDSPSSKVFF